MESEQNEALELRVGGSTNVHHLAKSIVKSIEEGKQIILSCIGLPAISVAVKSVAVANGHTAPQGNVLYMLPSFQLKAFADKETGKMIEMTAVRLTIVRRRIGH